MDKIWSEKLTWGLSKKQQKDFNVWASLFTYTWSVILFQILVNLNNSCLIKNFQKQSLNNYLSLEKDIPVAIDFEHTCFYVKFGWNWPVGSCE